MQTNSNLTITSDGSDNNNGFNNTYIASYKKPIIHCKHWDFVDFNIDNLNDSKTTSSHYIKALDYLLQQGLYSCNHYQILISLHRKLKKYVMKLQKQYIMSQNYDSKDYDNLLNCYLEKIGMVYFTDSNDNRIASYFLIH